MHLLAIDLEINCSYVTIAFVGKAKPAVKVHCLDILVFLSKRYGWIAEELPHVIELQMIDASPGLKNKGVKVLGLLRKKNY